MVHILIDYIIRNKKNFIVLTILFCLGISIGIFFINNSDTNDKEELNTYIEDLICRIKNDQELPDRLELLGISFKENFITILIIWLLGCTVIGGVFIYVTIIYKGFAFGYTIAAIIAVLGVKAGTIVAIVSLMMHNIIFIPTMFLIAENGIKLYKGIYTKCINLKEEVIRHTVIMLITIMLSLIASLVEVYISTNLLIFLKEII